MTVQLTSEQEARLSEIAAQAGRGVDDLAREAVDRYLAEDARFRAEVQKGIDEAERGELLTAGQVWERVERVLRS
ncbi:MAG: CopG family ribbon-helix-helix protein [Terracidiphilus sp.]